MESVRSYVDRWVADLRADHVYPQYPQCLEIAGFCRVSVGRYVTQPQKQWLMDNIGYENFNWIGRDVWFGDRAHAVWFAIACPDQ